MRLFRIEEHGRRRDFRVFENRIEWRAYFFTMEKKWKLTNQAVFTEEKLLKMGCSCPMEYIELKKRRYSVQELTKKQACLTAWA